MSLEKLASDLANFKYGMSSPDKLDNQTENGVDFIPNTDAPGFTPKTDLESLYIKANSAVGATEFIPASDGTFGPEGGGVAPYANLKPLESRRSAFIPTTNGAIGLSVDGVHPPALAEYSSIAEWKASQIYKPFTKTMTTLLDMPDPQKTGVFSISNQPAGLSKSNPNVLDAYGSNFMVTPLANYTSRYSPPNILSQTFTLSPPELLKPDFSSWMAFSAIGDNVTQFASLLPLTARTSQFSFPEADRQINISATPEGFLGLQTTFDLPRESWRYSAEATNDVFKDSFSTLGLGSSHFTDTIDLFHRYEKSDFTNVPGVSTDNLFLNRSLGEGGSFRKAADPNNTHPIVLRPFGSNWKNAHEDLEYAFGYAGLKSVELNFGKTLGIGGVGLQTEASRNIADYYRLDQWFSTPQGDRFIEKHISLQKMNPTIETKFYNEDSKFGVTGGFPAAHEKTVLPIFHPQRHAGGVLARYETVLNLTGLNAERRQVLQDPNPSISDLGSIFIGGSRLAYQAEAFSVDIPKDTSAVNTDNQLFNTVANFAIDTFNAVVDLVKAPIMIGLSNPNKYSPWPSAAPISTHLGIVAFGTPTAFVAVDTLLALHKKGGTFNKKTAKKTDGELIKNHATFNYGELHINKSYEMSGKLQTPRELAGNIKVPFTKRTEGKAITDSIGNPGQLSTVIKKDDKLGLIKVPDPLSNVDKINIHPYGEDLPEKLNDFIKFKFRDVVNNKYIIFRAILDGISDSITPEYGEERYIGRPDKVYVYQGADRSVSFNFSIYPKTKQEFPILMDKLNHLIGLCYPSYTKETEMMITPFMELTIGNMFVNASGLLWGLTVTVEDNSTWEIDEGLQFPHYIKAACEFKYIGNNKLSSTSTNHYNAKTEQSSVQS